MQMLSRRRKKSPHDCISPHWWYLGVPAEPLGHGVGLLLGHVGEEGGDVDCLPHVPVLQRAHQRLVLEDGLGLRHLGSLLGAAHGLALHSHAGVHSAVACNKY